VRGTVRIALRTAGLKPPSLAADQLAVVLRKVLPSELASRSVPDADHLCEELAEAALRQASTEPRAEKPDRL